MNLDWIVIHAVGLSMGLGGAVGLGLMMWAAKAALRRKGKVYRLRSE